MSQFHFLLAFNLVLFLTVDEIRTVNTPGFADSVTEGDIRWEKGMEITWITMFSYINLNYINGVIFIIDDKNFTPHNW